MVVAGRPSSRLRYVCLTAEQRAITQVDLQSWEVLKVSEPVVLTCSCVSAYVALLLEKAAPCFTPAPPCLLPRTAPCKHRSLTPFFPPIFWPSSATWSLTLSLPLLLFFHIPPLLLAFTWTPPAGARLCWQWQNHHSVRVRPLTPLRQVSLHGLQQVHAFFFTFPTTLSLPPCLFSCLTHNIRPLPPILHTAPPISRAVLVRISLHPRLYLPPFLPSSFLPS